MIRLVWRWTDPRDDWASVRFEVVTRALLFREKLRGWLR